MVYKQLRFYGVALLLSIPLAAWVNTATAAPLMNMLSGIGSSIFYVGDDGKVGIGTSTPTESLEVVGNVKVNGNLSVSGTYPSGGGGQPQKSINLSVGSSQYLTISDSNQHDLDLSSDMTVELWIRWNTVPGTNRFFVDKADCGAGPTFPSYRFYYDGSNNLMRVAIDNGAGSGQDSGVSWSPSANVWYHVAAVYDHTAGSVKFYVNGSQQGSTQTGYPSSIGNNSTDFTIGNDSCSVNTTDAKFDSVQIWNVARTAFQISNDMNVETPSASGLVGSWNFNDTISDLSGDGNLLTNHNGATFSSDTPF